MTPPPRRTVESQEPALDAGAWDEATPARHAEAYPATQWAESEQVAAPPTAPEATDEPVPNLPPVMIDEEPPAETRGRVIAAPEKYRIPPLRFSRGLAATRAGVELGRPLFAVGAIGALIAIGALVLAGAQAGQGVAVGALAATLNLWAFTRIGGALLSRHGLRAPWGVLGGLKLLALFGGVAVILKMELAEPLAFLVGYLALPVGIVASQLLGLQADFEDGERPI